MVTYLIASSNRNKLTELSSAARGSAFTLISPDVTAASIGSRPPEVAETAGTYAGNAELKARAYAAWSRMPAIADDSGLEVDCLAGRPGVLSARYGGSGIGDSRRCELLLEEVRQKVPVEGPGRRAWFVCSLVAVATDGEVLAQAEYRMEGLVIDDFRGEGGFGYDPIIFIPELGATLAEIPFERVCREGFRARAAEELFVKLSAKLPA
ncbi:MAG: non-canonical purine NTP pyrophosphatase [bacterium]|nr:non-canonical purine NTP pyrophosphatase [bacterium]